MKDDIPSSRRRAFLRRSAAAIVAAFPGGSTLTAFAAEDRTTSPLRSVSEYRAGAQVYRTAIADLARLPSMLAATASDIAQLLTIADRAARGLDQRQSWMVMHFLSDPDVVAGVRKTVRDKASFDALMQDLVKDLQLVMTIPGTVAARTRLDAFLKSHRQITEAAGARLLDVRAADLARSGFTRDLATRAAFDQARSRVEAAQNAAVTAMVMAVVTAVLIVVISVVVATVTFGTGLTTAYVETRAVDLQSAWKELRGAALLRCLAAADLRYQSCLGAIPSTATTAERNRARLRCQALWLAEKSSCSAA